MAKQRKSPEKQAISRNPDGTFIKGVSGNPEGKIAGTLDFKTQWFNFIEKVAKQNNLEPIDIDNEIFAMVLKEIRKGNFQFYKDTKDRVNGPVSSKVDMNAAITYPKPIYDGRSVQGHDSDKEDIRAKE